MVGGQSEGFVIFHKPNTTIYIYIVYLYVAHDCEMGFGCDGYMQIETHTISTHFRPQNYVNALKHFPGIFDAWKVVEI